MDMVILFLNLENTFGVDIGMEQVRKVVHQNKPPDITVGGLFDLVSQHASVAGVFDGELDDLWSMFRQIVSDALNVKLGDVTKEKWLIRDLGAN